MKQENSELSRDMAFGQRMMLVTTPDADMKENRDYILQGGLSIAYRRRRFPLSKYGEISIRDSRANGAKTEKQKILDGECKSKLFIWEFTDCWIICQLNDVIKAIRSGLGYTKHNNDGVTAAYYISYKNLNHLLISKAESL